MRDIVKIEHGLKPALLMLVVQIAFASVNVLYRLAIKDEMSVRIVTAYGLIFATASTVPLSLIFERSLMLDENLYLGSVIGAVLIVIGLYMVLWGKSKEMKKVTHLETTLEVEEIEVVVTSMDAADHDKCMCSNDSYTGSSKSNNKIVGKDHDNVSKREHEGQDNENNRKEVMALREVSKA